MTKRITKASVIPLRPHVDARSTSAQDRLVMAERKAREAWAASGSKRARLAQDALTISDDCSEAYMALATASSEWQARVNLYRQALACAERVLGADWEKEYKGRFWTEPTTRSLMRAMANLANALRWEDELEEAAEIYRQLLRLNPQDQQENRFELASLLLEAKEYKELDKLLAKFKDDFGAPYLYTRALYLYSQEQRSPEAATALKDALAQNHRVPLYLTGLLETPDEKPTSFAPGSHDEAIAYAWDNSFLWFDMEGAADWLADTIAGDQRYDAEDPALMKEIMAELRGDVDGK